MDPDLVKGFTFDRGPVSYIVDKHCDFKIFRALSLSGYSWYREYPCFPMC